MVPLEREIWDDLFSAAFANMIFAFFNPFVPSFLFFKYFGKTYTGASKKVGKHILFVTIFSFVFFYLSQE